MTMLRCCDCECDCLHGGCQEFGDPAVRCRTCDAVEKAMERYPDDLGPAFEYVGKKCCMCFAEPDSGKEFKAWRREEDGNHMCPDCQEEARQIDESFKRAVALWEDAERFEPVALL